MAGNANSGPRPGPRALRDEVNLALLDIDQHSLGCAKALREAVKHFNAIERLLHPPDADGPRLTLIRAQDLEDEIAARQMVAA